MRILFATNTPRIPSELAANYAGVQIAGILPSYSAAIATTKDAKRTDQEINTVILDARLFSALDKSLNLDLTTTIKNLHEIDPKIKIVVSANSPTWLEGIGDSDIETFVEPDPLRVTINLATHLGLSLKTELAVVVAIISLQGGTGRTYIARNLATAFEEGLSIGEARDENRRRDGGTKRRALLLELNLHHPTLGYLQNFSPMTLDMGHKTIAGLLNIGASDEDNAENFEEFSIESIDPYIINAGDNPIGCDLLLAPHGLMETIALYQANPNLEDLQFRLGKILDVLVRSYQVVVIDTGYDLLTDPGATLAIDRASSIVATASSCAAGLSNIAGLSIIIGQKNLSRKSLLVVNQGVQGEQIYLPTLLENAKPIFKDIETIGSDPKDEAWQRIMQKIWPYAAKADKPQVKAGNR
jgi:hypothetical protein